MPGMKRTTSGSSLYERLCEALRDPETMRKAGTLLLAKMIGLAIVLTLMTKWYLPSEAWADAAPALPPAYQRDQHRVDTGCRIPGVLHAGRIRNAGVGVRALARDRQHPGRRNRRHLHLRRDILALGFRLHVLRGHAMDRHHRIHAARASGNLRFDWSAA